ncbi:MAG: M14 family metallopeptidase [Gemmatimonadota bacterium]
MAGSTELTIPVTRRATARARVPLPTLLLAALAAPLGAQAPPSPQDVLGHALGERFTDHGQVVRYFDALAAASDLVSVERYGQTGEGRPLLQALIASADSRARLDQILALNAELTDPGTSAARAAEIAATNPAVVYLSYGVHGNESSSSEASMWTAWDLARGAEGLEGALEGAVVVIDPALNPDGRDRYVGWYRQARGANPNPRPEAREHWEPWPGGRFNHYLFDLNRDWSWATQPETRARLATWARWNPQVHVDFHEMSFNSTYFFFPAADPINPAYPEHTHEWGRRFGDGNAAAFDARGWPYYTAESFDLFYPGYGDTWPSLVGAIGMTYEQAGSARAGLAVERTDGVLLTLRDRAQHHRVAGHATIMTAVNGRGELLEGFARFHRDTGADAGDVLLVPGADPSRAAELVGMLQEQGVQVEVAGRAFEANAGAHNGFSARRSFPAGTYRVRARQPRGRLATTLLEPETELNATYSYDVSAWSLPYAFGVEAHTVRGAPAADWTAAPGSTRLMGSVAAGGWTGSGASLARPAFAGESRSFVASSESGPDAPAASASSVGYLVAPGMGAWRGVARLLAAGGRAIALDEGFDAAGRSWPAGTFWIPAYANDDLDGRLASAGLTGAATPVATGSTVNGNDLGTEESYDLSLPRIGLLAGEGVSPTSLGAHWFFLERTLGVPFDQVPADGLGAGALAPYDVLIVPSVTGSGRRTLDGAGDALGAWVRAGGTLVAVSGGASALAELAEVERVQDEEDDDEEEDEGDDDDLEDALLGREARELERWEQSVPGTIFELSLDPAHPLAFGAGVSSAGDGDADKLFVLHSGDLAFMPDEEFESAAYFPAELAELSGVISEENLESLEQRAWLVSRRMGAGKVILFADDPLFRHFWFGAFQPYANAVLLGPAY